MKNKISSLISCTVALPFLCSVNGSACISSKCHCYEYLRIIDRTRVGLHSLPDPALNLGSYSQLLLRHIYLQYFNISLVMALLPTVNAIDLRDNDQRLCKNLSNQRPPKWLYVTSNCGVSTTSTARSESNRTTEVSYTRLFTKASSPRLTSSTNLPSTLKLF